ncbi:acyl-CoA dehydrogenase family protein [Sinomonas sp. G460-2]|uniref:acyl-CoA dehydrogenase family protein n=1 Tax=Sinomonas sp. G460-2 TaxID=3393464 RepID=UPI0039EE7CFF
MTRQPTRPAAAPDVGSAADLLDIARSVLADYATEERVREFDEAERFDAELYLELARAGLLSAALSTAGKPHHGRQTAILEELGAGPTSIGVAFVVQYMAVELLASHGTEQQKAEFLDPLLEGAARASFALSEPDGGTDVARAMKTVAVALPDGSYSISGQKKWIGGAMDSDYLILLARTAPISGSAAINGITTFLVRRGTPGIESQEIETMGIRGLAQCDIRMDDVRVPGDCVLGRPDFGFRQVLATLNGERLNAAAVALGIARGAFGTALDWARSRYAFGRAVGGFQALQHSLVDTSLKIEAAALLLEKAVKSADSASASADVESALAKLAASEAAISTTDVGMRLMGGWGFARAMPMQRYFRDARLYAFAPLTNEMIRNYLGERMLHLPRSY